jgi:hypothetical protein
MESRILLSVIKYNQLKQFPRLASVNSKGSLFGKNYHSGIQVAWRKAPFVSET